MLKETGRVVAVDKECLWVETINQSTCGSCSAEKGCGQSVIAKWSAKNSYIKVLLNDRNADTVHVDDSITIGIPEDVIVKSSLLIYCLPILLLVIGAATGQSIFSTELASVIGAVIGLGLGGLVVSLRSFSTRRDPRAQPVILDIISSAS